MAGFVSVIILLIAGIKFLVRFLKKRKAVANNDIVVESTEEETKVFQSFADSQQISLTELSRKAILEFIEDELDRKAYDEAMESFKNNPVLHSHDEVMRRYGLD